MRSLYHNRKAWFVRGIGIVMACVVVLGFGVSSAHAQDEKVTIVWTEWWDEDWGVENVDWIITSFEATHPHIRVEKVYVPWDDMYARLVALVQAGKTPDVMAMEADWVFSFERIAANLDPLLDNEPEFRDNFPDSALIRWNGDTKLIWLYMMSHHFVYNVDLFAEHGIEPPTDWQALKTVLQQLRDPQKGTYGLALQLSVTSSANLFYRLFFTPLVQFGGRLLDDDGRAAFDSEAGVRVLEYWQELIDADLVAPRALETTEDDIYEMLASGKVAMMLTGPWAQAVVQQKNAAIRLAYCPPFHAATSGYISDGSGFVLSSQSAHPEAAWEFFKYLWSDDVALQMTAKTGVLWATKTALAAPFLAENPMLTYQPAMLNDPATQPNVILPEMNNLLRVLAENIQSFYIGQKDAQTALNDAAAYWNDLISMYQ